MSERELFIAALQYHDPAERAAFLAKACGRGAVRSAVMERCWRRPAEAGEFLERPAPAPRKTSDPPPIAADDNGLAPPTSAPEAAVTKGRGPAAEAAGAYV